MVVLGNSGNLQHAFLNVLSNAIHAIHKRGEIILTTTVSNDQAIVVIKDNGVGIEADILSKISDPFFTTKDPGEGIGLGLSITSSIIQEHNGSITYTSEVNKGTIVNIILPLKNY